MKSKQLIVAGAHAMKYSVLIAGAIASSLFGAVAAADTWPSKPVSLIVPFAAGGTTDVLARALGDKLSTIASSVYKSLSYDFQKSFEPITTIALVPNVLVINANNTKAGSVKELVELAKKSSPSMAFDSNGYGTLQHLIGVQFAAQNGNELLHVPYKGGGPIHVVGMSFNCMSTQLNNKPQIKLNRIL